MAWTYLSTAPNSSAKSWVRLRIGDTSSGDQLLQNEEIDALVEDGGNKYAGAALAAETVGAYFARRADKRIGKLQISMAKTSEHFFQLADRLRVELAEQSGGVYVGGVSLSDKEEDKTDTDAVQPSFAKDQFENPSDDSTGASAWGI